MGTRRVFSTWRFGVAATAVSLALFGWACGLNPQPIPPGETDSDAAPTAAPGENGGAGGDKASDSGTPNDATGSSDAAADAHDGGDASDAGDARTDAPADAADGG